MTRLIKSEKSNLPQIFYSIVQAIGRVVNLPVSIWIPDEKSQTLTIKASIGLPIAYVHKAYLRLSESSVTGDAFKSGKVIEVHSILSDPRWKYKKDAQEMGWNSVLCVPIKVRKSVVGVISIYSFVARNFSEMEKRLLFDYASQLELSIEAERMKETLNRLFDLGQNIEKKIAKQPKVVLQEIVNTFSDITGADCVVLYPYDYQRENFFDINNVAACGLRIKLNPSDKPRIEGGMAAFVKYQGKVVIEDIKKEYPAMLDSPFINREGIRSFMGIALTVSNRPLGILYIDFRAPRSFSQDEQKIIQLFAHQAAIAINNAHLYQHINSRARALSKLHKVTPRLVSVSPNPKDLKSVLNLIAKDAQLVLGADLVDLYQYDQNKDDFILPPVQLGTRYEPFSIIDKILEDDIVREVIKTGSLYATNAQEEKPLIQPSKFVRPKSPKQRFVVREKIQSMAGIPLAVGNEIVGVLFANYRSSQTFSRQQKELIELFAGQAAIAIYNSRLFHQARQQSKALEKLQSIGVDLISLTGTSENLLSVLKKIAYSAQEVLKADLVDLYQYFEESDKYELPPVQVGKRNAPYVRKEKIQEDDVIWSIVNKKKAKYTSNSQDSTELNTSFAGDRTGLPVSRFVIREEIKSTAAVPLKVGSKVVGILFANYRSPQTFLPQQRTLIELFAAQAAIAIHNSRLYWESVQRSMRLELVNNIAAAISSTTDAKTILQIAVNGLAKVLGVKQSAVALFDEAGEFANILVEYLEPDCVSALGHKIPLKNNAQIEKILKTKKPLSIDDVQNDPIMERTRKIMAKRKTLSLMVVPILIDEKVVGTIGVDAVGEKRHFTDEEAELAQAIANQAATTLRIAQQLEKRLNDVRALQEITEQMHKGDLKEVLNLIAEHAVDLTEAKHGGVWLVNKTRTALEFGGLAYKSQYKHVPPNIPLDESSGNSFSKWVVLNKKPYKSGNVHKDKQYKPYYKDTRSELTVPIIYREKVIGTIKC
jgi:GAF domain-containing protein